MRTRTIAAATRHFVSIMRHGARGSIRQRMAPALHGRCTRLGKTGAMRLGNGSKR